MNFKCNQFSGWHKAIVLALHEVPPYHPFMYSVNKIHYLKNHDMSIHDYPSRELEPRKLTEEQVEDPRYP